MVKNLPTNAGDVRDEVLGQEDPLEKEMATHSSILAWRISWMGCHWSQVKAFNIFGQVFKCH